MHIDNVVDLCTAAEYIGITRNTAKDYIMGGALPAEIQESPRLYRINSTDLMSFRRAFRSYDTEKKRLRAAYACVQTGVPENLAYRQVSETDRQVLDYLRSLYLFYRNRLMQKYRYSGDPEAILTTAESLARLKLTSHHALYKLIENRNLKVRVIKLKGRNLNLVLLESMIEYLGPKADKLLFRISDVSRITGFSTVTIDRIAHELGLGLKSDSKQSRYLFDTTEISAIRAEEERRKRFK